MALSGYNKSHPSQSECQKWTATAKLLLEDLTGEQYTDTPVASSTSVRADSRMRTPADDKAPDAVTEVCNNIGPPSPSKNSNFFP